MDDFADYPCQAGQAQYHYQTDNSRDHSRHRLHPVATSSISDPQCAAFVHATVPPPMSCEVKPRLTKEQHDYLESHFQKQQKPNTNTKKGFAESLNVSLDKVNNWFQNRRAKSKQDEKKKAAGAKNLFNVQQQANSLGFISNPDISPAFSSPDYLSVMQQCTGESSAPGAISTSQMPPGQSIGQNNGLPYHLVSAPEQFSTFVVPEQAQLAMFDSMEELNRRTLTQEQFDAMEASSSSLDSTGHFTFPNTYCGDAGSLRQYFSEASSSDIKQQEAFFVPHAIGAPLSSFDSTVPSSGSEQSLNTFPSSSSMQERASMSASSSEWGDSNSSTLSLNQTDGVFMGACAPQGQPNVNAPRWQPGQSVPVDFTSQMREFQQAAQARQATQHQQGLEQPLAYLNDEVFSRRDSSASMLAQSMNNVDLKSPSSQQAGDFQSPGPPSNIAARRQRPRPAALALRSQSYNGAVQPGSPGAAVQQQNGATNAQQLRRIRSSNMVNGVAQGRIAKTVSNSGHRSPLAYTFSDTANSPVFLQHAATQSTGNIAPPTPLSPRDFQRSEQFQQQSQTWHSASGQASRQPSISESDEFSTNCIAAVARHPQNFSSPPRTPHNVQPNYAQQRIGNSVITENTPPQSAPASQACFPTNMMAMSQPQVQIQGPIQTQGVPQPQVVALLPPEPPHLMTTMAPDQQLQMPQATFAPSQAMMLPATTITSEMPMQYIGGAPVVNDQGELVMAYAQATNYIPQAQHAGLHPQHQAQAFSSARMAAGLQATPQAMKPPLAATPGPELFFHEWAPPQDVKRSCTPRKALDSGPKSYTFANQGPEHFEKGDKSKKSADSRSSSTASSSPASSATGSTS